MKFDAGLLSIAIVKLFREIRLHRGGRRPTGCFQFELLSHGLHSAHVASDVEHG